MIKSLHIRNYAIIESLEINFSEGLTIITGETGAGKSILLGALGLIMGNRADTKSLYNEAEKCVVEARFDIRSYQLQAFFTDNDIEYDEETIIRREIAPSGKSRAFINDSPVNLNVLQQLSSALIDLHQQFDTLDIHNVSFQLRMIDALADNKRLAAGYEEEYRQYIADKRRLDNLIHKNEASAKEVEFLQFQLEEFNKAELMDGEQERSEQELSVLANAEEIKRTMSAAFQYLSESEQSLVSQMEELGIMLHQIGKYDGKLAALSEKYDGLTEELKDIAGEFETIAEQTEYDPERITEIQARLDLIYRLENKHRVGTVRELLDIQENLQAQLGEFGDLSTEIETLRKRIAEQETHLYQVANMLSERRHLVVPDFEDKVRAMLSQLSMEHAVLKVDCKKNDTLGPTGLDELNFLFTANKGGRLQMIKDVASGGELARLTLVTKSLVASAIPLPTLIFDEIDVGVSGDVALRMGNILRQLSNHHQVVTITHSPQVASKADAHYFAYKVEKEDRVITKVKALSRDERIRAIATMLSQNPPSEAAIENARQLMEV
ncbi:MAG TPA: DNA repair protein RecN [Saprospiraceae bacterium]|mgnify:FL=1|nr:DNA repair protein RecN [Saprospiraceae bacterium]HMP24068.1 DNA repair protein RecN [Saprospiraceae bacterium]